ncbi:MAG: hypothetical protein HYS15_01795 [Candidatus Spechtbacteria bacterium]|nr:hypothetical protein [Candidatus Spechtbacteria bacterium]
MKEAFTITTIIIFLALILGVMYNTMAPYLVKLGVIEQKNKIVLVERDGGVFRSQDSAYTFSRIADNGGVDTAKEEVIDIQFDPRAPHTLIMGTNKGLYRSDDKGDQWRQTSYKSFLSAGDSLRFFAIDPENSERFYAAIDSKGIGRILKSRGAEFYEVYSAAGSGDQILGIWVDSYDPSTVFAGTKKGIFLESRDFGESWRIKKDFEEPVRKLLMFPSDTRNIFAAVGDARIFKTKNQGAVWQDVSSALRLPKEGVIIQDLALDRKNEDHVYVLTNKGLLASENGGASFFDVPLVSSPDGSFVSAIALDPEDSKKLYLGIGPQIHKSIDGGKSWQVKTLPTKRHIQVLKILPDDGKTIFVGMGAAAQIIKK